MAIYLLDESIMVKIYYEEKDCDYSDNICVSIDEDCPIDEKILRANSTNIYLTAKQARQLAEALLTASVLSQSVCQETEDH